MGTALLSKESVAEGTMCFRFEKPEGFAYIAGQSVDLFLVNPPETDAEGNKRAFSLSSAPHEPQLAITTRMRDTAFKRVLKEMVAGTTLTLDGPFGDLVLHENVKRPAIFLAGGIGITPFYSMVKDAVKRALPHRIILFYSNRRPEDAAYLGELEELTRENPNFSLIATMTEMEKSSKPWEGERGYITPEMIQKHVDQTLMPIYYLAGPSTMTVALRDVLAKIGVSRDDMRTEEFIGY